MNKERKIPPAGKLLRIFISESDRHDGRPLFEWLVERARETGLAGATVLRGMEGFGCNSHLHTSKILSLSNDLPIVVEIIDAADRVEAFLEEVNDKITDGLATVENVRIHVYRANRTQQD